jgi:hypothetical protein
MSADVVLLHARDESALAYEFGANPIHTVVVNGAAVRAGLPPV